MSACEFIETFMTCDGGIEIYEGNEMYNSRLAYYYGSAYRDLEKFLQNERCLEREVSCIEASDYNIVRIWVK